MGTIYVVFDSPPIHSTLETSGPVRAGANTLAAADAHLCPAGILTDSQPAGKQVSDELDGETESGWSFLHH